MGELYKLTFRNGKSYIGIAIKSAKKRLYFHGYAARKSGKPLYAAWRKYGTPVMEVLAVVENSLLHEMEIKAIAAYGTFAPDGRGYNLTRGGEGVSGWIPSAEWRTKRIAALTGKILSPETRAKISAAHMGKSISPEHRAKIGKASRGRIPSAETRAKIGSAGIGNQYALGNKLTTATRARMSSSRKGMPKSLEHRAKISAALLGRRLSQETRAKISAARRKLCKGKEICDVST